MASLTRPSAASLARRCTRRTSPTPSTPTTATCSYATRTTACGRLASRPSRPIPFQNASPVSGKACKNDVAVKILQSSNSIKLRLSAIIAVDYKPNPEEAIATLFALQEERVSMAAKVKSAALCLSQWRRLSRTAKLPYFNFPSMEANAKQRR
ncbi:uncharacterized protein LOC111241266 [Vigna radiata var. radiata]|uniref:Uncharacterized protein LOC111241266 n=1 Tax=Vigna radiata var. radiata TaxID=3916 RepID=A0A3Q0EQR6_VIGRR|nr:uncharacterized protein LOC111241266 [Vigna radiata var. radiata]